MKTFSPKSNFIIINKSFELYLNNFFSYQKGLFPFFIIYIIGFIWITYFFYNFENIFPLEVRTDLNLAIISGTIISMLPGFAILFWGGSNLLQSYASLSRYTNALISFNEGVTLKACLEYVYTRFIKYFLVLLTMLVFWCICLFIPLLPLVFGFNFSDFSTQILTGVLTLFSMLSLLLISVLFSLSFQIFSFENLSYKNIFIRSFILVKNNYITVLLLLLFIALLSLFILPLIFYFLMQSMGIINFLLELITPVMSIMFLKLSSFSGGGEIAIIDSFCRFGFNNSEHFASLLLILHIILFSVILILPLGSACFTQLYLALTGDDNPKDN